MARVSWLYYYYTAKVIAQENSDKFHGFPETIAQQAMEEAIDGRHGNITHGNGGYFQYNGAGGYRTSDGVVVDGCFEIGGKLVVFNGNDVFESNHRFLNVAKPNC